MKKKLFTLFLAASLIVATAASPLHADTASARSATKHADTTDTCTVHYKTLQEGGLLSYQHSNGKKAARKTATVSAKTQYALEAMLADTLDSFQDTCDFSALQLNTSTFCDLFYSYLDQHPRYFYVSGKISYYYDSNRIITKVRFNYKYSKTEAQSMLSAYDAAVNQALSGVNPLWSDMEKALYLNDYLALQAKYDDSLSKFSAYNNLVEKTSVCQGYALAYQELLTDVGIPCQIVTSDSLNHAWNMLYIDGKYYYNDVTWNDPVPDRVGRSRHFYFLKSESFYRSSEGKHLVNNDWEVSGNWSRNDASDTSYDNYFWNDMDTGFSYNNGTWYNFNGSDSIYAYHYLNGQFQFEKTVVTVNDIWDNKNIPNSYWVGSFVGFASYGSNLYYSDSDTIYKLDITTNASTPIYELSAAEKASTNIVSLVCDATGRLSYITSSDFNSYETKLAMQLDKEPESIDKTTCYQIRFRRNGATDGMMDSMQNCLTDQTYTLPKNTFTRSNYTFTGWNTKADGTGTAYEDEASVTNLTSQNYASITLYAQWEKNAAPSEPTVTPPSSDKEDPADNVTPAPSAVIRLSAKKLTIRKGKTAKLSLNGSKKKAVWSILSGKKYISLKNRSNKSVVIKARKKGTAKVQAVVSGKKYVCTVKVN